MLGKLKLKKNFFNIFSITALACKFVNGHLHGYLHDHSHGHLNIMEQCDIVNTLLKIDDPSRSCCFYRRVVCDHRKENVIKLDLSGLNIKTLVDDIVNLPLIDLDLSNNSRMKKLPKKIKKLKHLEILNLSDMPKLTKLPDSFSSLQNLKILFLNNDYSLKKLPDDFGDLPKLSQLYAYSSGLTELPKSFINLRKLTTGDFSSCTKLYGVIPEFYSNAYLNFDNTNICYHKGNMYPKKWILPKNKYCETINISPITMGMVNANTSINMYDDDDDDDDEDDRCGEGYKACSDNECCSKYGYCGTSDEHCSIENECQTEYGICYDIGKDGTRIIVGLGHDTKKKEGNQHKNIEKETKPETKVSMNSPGTTGSHNIVSTDIDDSAENYRCGKNHGRCDNGQCCSKYGWCGTSEDFCQYDKCQPEYGLCWDRKKGSSKTIKKEPGRCGPNYGPCDDGLCCSKFGWCGSTDDFCDANVCLLNYGVCNKGGKTIQEYSIIRDDGRCGKGFGHCSDGTCCSKYGWCGTTESYCSIKAGCQKKYGSCNK